MLRDAELSSPRVYLPRVLCLWSVGVVPQPLTNGSAQTQVSPRGCSGRGGGQHAGLAPLRGPCWRAEGGQAPALAFRGSHPAHGTCRGVVPARRAGGCSSCPRGLLGSAPFNRWPQGWGEASGRPLAGWGPGAGVCLCATRINILISTS